MHLEVEGAPKEALSDLIVVNADRLDPSITLQMLEASVVDVVAASTHPVTGRFETLAIGTVKAH